MSAWPCDCFLWMHLSKIVLCEGSEVKERLAELPSAQMSKTCLPFLGYPCCWDFIWFLWFPMFSFLLGIPGPEFTSQNSLFYVMGSKCKTARRCSQLSMSRAHESAWPCSFVRWACFSKVLLVSYTVPLQKPWPQLQLLRIFRWEQLLAQIFYTYAHQPAPISRFHRIPNEKMGIRDKGFRLEVFALLN